VKGTIRFLLNKILYPICQSDDSSHNKARAGLLGWPPPCLRQSGWSLRSPALGSLKEAVVQADSFRSHAEQLQAVVHCIAAGSFQATNKVSNQTMNVCDIE
jgi:hypothetical protein